jgi:hypothetical protein
MDPKMDAGMATTKYKTADEAIESGAAPINLSVHQLVDVMDHLLACEVLQFLNLHFCNSCHLLFTMRYGYLNLELQE